MSVGLSSSQRLYLGMVQQALAAHPKWGYIDPPWVMTIFGIESGFQPLVWNGAGRQDGLGQVIPSTAAAMASLYGIPAGPQTDPQVSTLSTIAYMDVSARSIIKFRGTSTLPLWDLAQAYNDGFAAVEAGKLDPKYLVKFQAKLPVIEAQMAGTAMLTNQARFVPTWARVVMPLAA